jgi:hypothetical protein
MTSGAATAECGDAQAGGTHATASFRPENGWPRVLPVKKTPGKASLRAYTQNVGGSPRAALAPLSTNSPRLNAQARGGVAGFAPAKTTDTGEADVFDALLNGISSELEQLANESIHEIAQPLISPLPRPDPLGTALPRRAPVDIPPPCEQCPQQTRLTLYTYELVCWDRGKGRRRHGGQPRVVGVGIVLASILWAGRISETQE